MLRLYIIIVVILIVLLIVLALAYYLYLRKVQRPQFERDPTMPLAVVFRPCWDLATSYTNWALGLVQGDLSALGFQVLDIDSSGYRATATGLLSAIETYQPDFVVCNGHGAPDVLTGQDGVVVLKSCVNDQVMSGRVFTAISCLTGQKLGPSCREKTAQAYGGFVNEFSWIVTPPYDPATDPAWQSFQDVIRTIIVLAAKYRLGTVSFRDVYVGVMDRFNYWKDYYGFGAGAGDPNAGDIYMSLDHDQSGFIWIGEEVYVAPGVPLNVVMPLGIGIAGAVLSTVFPPEVG